MLIYNRAKSKVVKIYIQQDATEFLTWLLEELHQEGRKEELSQVEMGGTQWISYLMDNNSPVTAITMGQMCSTWKCTGCGNTDKTYDYFHCLPAQINTGQVEIKASNIPKDRPCPTCRSTLCVVSFTITRPPPVLMMQLVRIHDTGKNTKNVRFKHKFNIG